jgi:hypothetical protein
MALQLGALRDALDAAGIDPAKARAAAEEVAGYENRLASLDTRLGRIDTKLTVALWAGGLLFAAVLASQATLWLEVGKVDGRLAAISAQVAEIAQAVRR